MFRGQNLHPTAIKEAGSSDPGFEMCLVQKKKQWKFGLSQKTRAELPAKLDLLCVCQSRQEFLFLLHSNFIQGFFFIL